MQYGLSMKWHNSCNKQTDSIGLFCSLLFSAAPITIVDSQTRSDRSFFGRDAPFCVLMTRARDPCRVKRHLRVPGNTKRGIEPKFFRKGGNEHEKKKIKHPAQYCDAVLAAPNHGICGGQSRSNGRFC